MRILVTGGAGQLARAVLETWQGHELIVPDEGELNIADRAAVQMVLTGVRPEAVLNLAGYTQVDRCEIEEPQATLINGIAVGWLAETCTELGARLVHISTDYVFDGQGGRPYRETDPTGPLSAYGRTKLLGEVAAATTPRHLIARTAWLYDAWGRNFYRTMLALAAKGAPLKVVADQFGAPTSCRALARQLRAALEQDWQGLVHMTCQGETSWHGFATEIFRLKGLLVDLSPCTTSAYPTPARRPAYSVLSGTRRRELGADLMPTWQTALAEVVAADKETP